MGGGGGDRLRSKSKLKVSKIDVHALSHITWCGLPYSSLNSADSGGFCRQ